MCALAGAFGQLNLCKKKSSRLTTHGMVRTYLVGTHNIDTSMNSMGPTKMILQVVGTRTTYTKSHRGREETNASNK